MSIVNWVSIMRTRAWTLRCGTCWSARYAGVHQSWSGKPESRRARRDRSHVDVKMST